ncbi:MAG: nitroreductase family protein [Ornithinimicrobium sp.]
MELAEVLRTRRMVRTFDPDRAVPVDIVDRALHAATRAPSAGFSQGWDFVVLTDAADRATFWAAATPHPPDPPDPPDPPQRGGNTSPAAPQPDRWLRGVSAAPCLVVCCSDPQRYYRRYAEPDKSARPATSAAADPWPIPYWDVDTGMAALLMLLTGVDAGLGGLFFGVPAARIGTVAQALSIPADRRIVGVVALGYPLPDVRSPSLRRGRRPLAQVAHFGRFGVAWERPTSASTTSGVAHNAAAMPVTPIT